MRLGAYCAQNRIHRPTLIICLYTLKAQNNAFVLTLVIESYEIIIVRLTIPYKQL